MTRWDRPNDPASAKIPRSAGKMKQSVAAFSQVNAALLYVAMSLARIGMAMFTDCKAALREAVAKPSERVSALELMNKALKKVRLPFLAKTPGMEHAMREAARQQQARSMGMER
jgi:hypothetical protein